MYIETALLNTRIHNLYITHADHVKPLVQNRSEKYKHEANSDSIINYMWKQHVEHTSSFINDHQSSY